MSAAGPTLLRCGPLTAVLDGADLFDIRWGGAQVVQRLYLAVRDEVWNTIPATLSDIRLDADGTGATVTFEATHEHGDIAFAWTGTIRADASGLLAYEMRGTALRDFSYCKIGFNVHHGLRSHAGRAFRCRTLDGEHAGRFGADIEPQLVRDGTLTAMTPDYDRIDIDLGGVGVAMEFDGDRFEMQDHRNWIDANWKSYGTPLSAGFPMTIEAGAELYQRVVLRLRGPVPPELPAVVTARWSDDAGTLPRIGHLLAAPPDDGQVALLRALHPDHLRVDLHPGDDPSGLAQAAALSRRLGAGLEVAVFIRPDHVEVDTPAAAWALAGTDARIDRVLVLVETAGFSAFGGACPPRIATAVRSALIARGLPGAPVVAGTSQSFVDVNRDRPDYSGIDGVVFAANPQVHAADDRSLMQNVQAVPDVVDFTRRLYGDVAVVLSPVDLIGVNGPYPAGPAEPGGPPANQDPRQRSAFAAAWTVGALASMARCGTTSTTLFELVGPRGLLDEHGPYPVAAVLEHLAQRRGSPLRGVEVDDPDRLAVLALADPVGVALLVANLTDAALVAVLPAGERLDLAAYSVVAACDGAITRIA